MNTNGCRRGANVLGVHIDAIEREHCVAQILDWAGRHESRCVYLCNVHSVMTARREREFGRIVNGADLAAPDGAPIAWRLRHLGYPGQQRISGSELMWKCCARAAQRGVPIFLYGSTQETLRRISERLVLEFPALRIAGCHAPPHGPTLPRDDAKSVHLINSSGAGIVFVALGCPKQEAWMDMHRGEIHAVMLGVGAAFDFHSGLIRRAPEWMQNAGLEWLHRLLSEPRRLWRRYLVTNTLFCFYLVAELLHRRPHERGSR